jgi:ABC-type transport system involved in cytochrome bd biosynthesis fused ATPase/permease subunit
MKDGELVESGTHDELLAQKGEYHRLFTVQAQAFASTVRMQALLASFQH